MDTILTVRAEDFNRIDEEKRAVNFFQELLWAEATRVGIPLSNINISLSTKVPDGGVDASARQPTNVIVLSNMITDEYNAYQIKAGPSFKPWELAEIRKELFGKKKPAKENLGSMVRDCLDQNGRYVLVCFGYDLTDDQRKKAIEHLETYLSKDCKYKHPKVNVWSRNNLASFLKPFPSLVLSVKRGARAFQTHQGWANDENMQFTFAPGDSQTQRIHTLQETLRQNNFHIRIIGEPGIGKTRLVFEATKTDELRPLVIYCHADAFWGSDLMYEIIREDNEYHIILVVDECNSENRSLIANKLKKQAPRVKLVTIYTEYDNVSDVNYLDVTPLDESMITRIIQEHSAMPEDQARKWATVCDGSPRVAHVVGLNLSRDQNGADILREPDIERVWDRYIEGGDDPKSTQVQQRRLVLMYLSLFKRFGFGQSVRTEAENIHKLIHQDDPAITWGRFAGIIKELKGKKILQGENTLYITPKLLHIKLWIDWWETYGVTFTGNELLNLPPSSLLDWFFEMFEYAAGSDVASRTVRELLGSDGPFQSNSEILKTDRGARFFRFLGEVEPVAAVKCLQRTIGTWDKDTLLEFKNGRRDVIWLLEKTAQWRELFVPSARLLLGLAEAENESWSNNASGIFTELFAVSVHPKLSQTEAAPGERFPIIEEALNSESSGRRNLALQACDRALSERTFGSVSNRLQVFGREPDFWSPATWGELFDAYRQVWSFLIGKLDELPTEERNKASEILIQHIRNLGAIPNLAEMVASDVSTLASKSYISDRKLLETVIQLLHYGKNLQPEVRTLWEQVKDELTGDDYHSSMKRYVSMNLPEDQYDDEGNRRELIQTKIQELARESFRNPDLLADELSWLVTTNASNGYQFGYALAQEDNDFSLIHKLLDAQRGAGENASLYFLGGYLRSLSDNNLQEWEDLMDDLAQDSETAVWVLELTQRTGRVTSQAAKRVLHVLQDNKLPSWLLHQFMYGGILNDLPEEAFIDWIEFLLKQPESAAVYVALGLYSVYYVRKDITIKPPANLTFKLLSHELFSEIPEDFRQGNARVMYPYYWKLVASSFIMLYPNRCLELSAFMLQHFNNYDTIFSNSAPRSVLRAIITRYPREVWVQIASYLEGSYAWQLTHWLRGDDFFSQPREEDKAILPLFPQDAVWQWVEEDVEERAWYLATFVPPILDRENSQLSWARELLIRYGQRDDVRRNLWSNFSTEGWTGNESDHLELKRQQLLIYRTNEINEQVNEWLDEYIESIEKRIEHARIEEERTDF